MEKYVVIYIYIWMASFRGKDHNPNFHHSKAPVLCLERDVMSSTARSPSKAHSTRVTRQEHDSTKIKTSFRREEWYIGNGQNFNAFFRKSHEFVSPSSKVSPTNSRKTGCTTMERLIYIFKYTLHKLSKLCTMKGHEVTSFHRLWAAHRYITLPFSIPPKL